MNDQQTLETLITKLAGIAGAVLSMRFINGTFLERVAFMVSGGVMAYFVSPWTSERLGMPEGITGFFVGFFGMAIASKVWEGIQEFPSKVLWEILLDRLRSFGRRKG